jgi:YVTN family beta-propeller protein
MLGMPFCWVQGGAPAIAVAAGMGAVSPTSVYVINLSDGTVPVIDPTTNMVVNTISVGHPTGRVCGRLGHPGRLVRICEYAQPTDQ